MVIWSHSKRGESLITKIFRSKYERQNSKPNHDQWLFEGKQSFRGDNVYVVQSTCAPVTERLMEVLICCDALKRASARSITCIMPYFGYARQDRKAKARQPITARLVADLLQTAGCHRLVTTDLHASQIQGFFNIPVDDVSALPVFYRYFFPVFFHYHFPLLSQQDFQNHQSNKEK